MLATSRVSAPALFAALTAVLGTACIFEGGVEIDFLWPDDLALAPSSEQIAEVTLVRSAPGEPVTRTVRRMNGNGEVDMGTIEAGDGLRLAVELRSSTQRLLGYGSAPAPIDLDPGGSVAVSMHVRRPFVYMTHADEVDAGGAVTPSAVDVFDSTLDTLGGQYHGSMSLVTGAVVSATTPDGTTLILGAPAPPPASDGWALYFVATSDHQTALRDPLGLRQKPSDLVVSPSGRYAVVAHGEAEVGGLSVIDLQDPDPVTGYSFVGLGQVDRVVVAPVAADSDLERAYALIDQSFECNVAGVQSRVVAVALDAPATGGPSIAFGGLIRDIAASSQEPFVVVANGCENKVEKIDPGVGVDRADLGPVPDVTAVAVIDGKVWGVGSDEILGGLGRQMSLVSVEIASGEVTALELPLLEERGTTDTFNNEGDVAFRQIVADTIQVIDLAVLPGAESIALMTHGEFVAEDVYGTINSQSVLVLPSMRITNNEYLLIDTATNSLVQRTRASCQIDILTANAMVGEGWMCEDGDPLVPYEEGGPTGFVPTSLSVLYEAR